MIFLPCSIFRYFKLSKESYYEIHFAYKKLFTVKLIVKDKVSYFKAKDVLFYSTSEVNNRGQSADLSSTELFRQMTFAAKRVHLQICCQ